jgi:DNA replication protein DnaC
MNKDEHDHKASDFLHAIHDMIESLPDAPDAMQPTEAIVDGETGSEPNLSECAPIPVLPSHFDGWSWWQAYDVALEAAKKGALIVIYGGHGRGKTQLCMEVARRLPDRFFPGKREGRFTMPPEHRPMIYRKAMEFFNDIRSTYGSKSKETERDVISRYANAALVVIDEAHQRGEKDFEDRQLTLMIDKRYDAMLPTILVTNLTREDFYATLSPAVKSRMIETAEGIEANWASFRTRKQSQENK